MTDGRGGESQNVVFSDRAVRQFAALCGAISFLFLGRQWWLSEQLYPYGLLTARHVFVLCAGLSGCFGVVYPSFVRPVLMVVMAVVSPVGHAFGVIMMGAMFYGALTPIALLLRALKRDPLQLKSSDQQTFWENVVQGKNALDYLRQYQKSTDSV